ncbi:MAG: AbrB/MazE/SpoVT family DNA-binding domain-containing protein [Calditrichaeota bacterium]|nr:AbrB/MazE/SpoVT family DNA-binding domain-containing protein [Calditrichota bacterium]
MNIKLIRIGTSQGIRIPKPIIEQCKIEDELDLRVEGKTIILQPIKKARENWERYAKKAVAEYPEADIDDVLGDEDFADWQW